MNLRVATFNIHHGEAACGRIDLEGQAAILRDSGADMALLQEVDVETERSGWLDQAKTLARLAGFPHYAFGRNLSMQGGAYGNAILSRFQLTAVTNHPIPLKDPNLPRPFLNGEIHLPEQRGILQATARIGSETVHLFCSHFGFLIDEPLEGSRALLELIRPLREPVIFGGDLNAWDERDAEIAPLREEMLDCGLAMGQHGVKTWPADGPRLRLDYLFVRGPYRPVSFRAIPTLVSDHHPVVVELVRG